LIEGEVVSRTLAICLAVHLCAGSWALAQADDEARLQAEVTAASRRFDAIIDAGLAKAGLTAVPAAEHGQFYRRLHLDIAGRIPDLIDVADYIDDPSENKQYIWADKLFKSERFAVHFANIFRSFILPSNNNVQVGAFAPQFDAFLRERLQSEAGWDSIVRSILSSQSMSPYDVDRPVQRAPAVANVFFAVNENKPENLASSVSRVFLGVKLECAQCHAHPFASWKREQFWEFAAFFSNVNQAVGFNQSLRVGREILIPGTNTTVKSKFLDGKSPDWKPTSDPRQVLAEWVTDRKNPYFAKAAADFLWCYFFGVSLLEQIEHAESEEGPSHPELLQALADEFVAHNFDLKFLMRAIVQTKAYQRSSGHPGKDSSLETAMFARMPVRGLTASQIFDSILSATGIQETGLPPINPNFVQPGQQLGLRGQFLLRFEGEEKSSERQTSILQALFLMNNKELTDKLKVQSNESLRVIATGSAYRDTASRVDSLYRWVLSRPPRGEETQRLVRYIDGGRDRTRAFEDVYWVLLNSGEFLLNH
jgi:hypothetical protein